MYKILESPTFKQWLQIKDYGQERYVLSFSENVLINWHGPFLCLMGVSSSSYSVAENLSIFGHTSPNLW